jgi:hypothetical protein
MPKVSANRNGVKDGGNRQHTEDDLRAGPTLAEKLAALGASASARRNAHAPAYDPDYNPVRERNQKNRVEAKIAWEKRSSSGWVNRFPCPFAGVRWASRLETVAPEGVYLGKIGSGFMVRLDSRYRPGRGVARPSAR